MIRRQYITADIDFDGQLWRVTVDRAFVLSALCRRQISETEFFEFMSKEFGAIALLAKRKIKRNGLTLGKVMLDAGDLPNYDKFALKGGARLPEDREASAVA